MKDWDEELDTVWNEIAKLVEGEAARRKAGPGALVAAKVEVMQAELELERRHQKIRRLVERDRPLLPRERALVHWARTWLEAATSFTTKRSAQLAEALWLKLIRTRLGATGSDGLGGEELVSLSVRRTNVGKTERYLQDYLAQLKTRRKELTSRFRHREITAANRAAARTLAIRLGPTPPAAFAGAEMAALKAFVRRTIDPLHRPVAAAHARAGAARLEEKSQAVLTAAKRMALARIAAEAAAVPPPRATTRGAGRLRATLDQLGHLEAETREAFAALEARMPELSDPNIVVHAGAKSAKNV